uniref:Uncharacterized protein n=1 Tax=Odontella aurita TaxID=265563 RepID=A0A7S4NHZ2_9STRA|mmetsp:Transcript_7022/g.21016  ORF Transcript_7022/g.21016 Transcript_7022/m.21016 type:complete len:178 (+) Transcript_7022:186-719(+)
MARPIHTGKKASRSIGGTRWECENEENYSGTTNAPHTDDAYIVAQIRASKDKERIVDMRSFLKIPRSRSWPATPTRRRGRRPPRGEVLHTEQRDNEGEQPLTINSNTDIKNGEGIQASEEKRRLPLLDTEVERAFTNQSTCAVLPKCKQRHAENNLDCKQAEKESCKEMVGIETQRE